MNKAQSQDNTVNALMITKYRELVCDTISSDEQISQRICYLTALCRSNARAEITALFDSKNKYVKSKKNKLND